MTKGKDISRLKSQKVATLIGFSTATVIYASCFIPLFMIARPAVNYAKNIALPIVNRDNSLGNKKDELVMEDVPLTGTGTGTFTENDRQKAQIDPITTIEYNYRSINEKRLKEAYQLRSNRVRQKTRYEKWLPTWENNARIQLLEKRLISNKGSKAVVYVKLLSADNINGKIVEAKYEGKVFLAKSKDKWYFDNASIAMIIPRKIARAVLCKSIDYQNKPCNITSNFGRYDRVFCFIDLINIEKGDVITVKWYRDNIHLKDRNGDDLTGSSTAQFEGKGFTSLGIASSNQWQQSSNYRVDLYVNKRFIESKSFSIE